MNVKAARLPLLTGILLSLLCACNNGSTYYSSHKHIEGSCWHRSDTVLLPIEHSNIHTAAATDDTLQLYVGVRYTNNYQYENLTVLAELTDDEGTPIWKDTVRLATSLSANNGFCYREAFQPTHSLRTPAEGSKYTLHVTHLMTLDPLEGITDIMTFLRQ